MTGAFARLERHLRLILLVVAPLWAGLVLWAAILVLTSLGSMPDQVPYAFGSDGLPRQTTDLEAFRHFYLYPMAGVHLFMFLIAIGLPWLPKVFLFVPFRDYFLVSEERFRLLRTWLRITLAVVGIWSAGLFLLFYSQVLQAVASGRAGFGVPHGMLANVGGVIILLGFMAGTWGLSRGIRRAEGA